MSVIRPSAIVLALCLSAVTAQAGETAWGAIAIDTEKAERDPYYGVGGADTEKEASATALGFCKDAGGVTCKTIVTYQACGALSVNGNGTAGWGTAATKAEAEAGANKACDDETCAIVVSDCNE